MLSDTFMCATVLFDSIRFDSEGNRSVGRSWRLFLENNERLHHNYSRPNYIGYKVQ